MASDTLAQIPVIHWEDAMQQVGDDEEFLRELLADLRSETEIQLQAIAAIIQVCCRYIFFFGFISISLFRNHDSIRIVYLIIHLHH